MRPSIAWLAAFSCLIGDSRIAAADAKGSRKSISISGMASTGPKVKCSSGIKGDFGYRTCAAFCKENAKDVHCKFCKCQDCTFCGGSAVRKVGNRSVQSGATKGVATELKAPQAAVPALEPAIVPQSKPSPAADAPGEVAPATPKMSSRRTVAALGAVAVAVAALLYGVSQYQYSLMRKEIDEEGLSNGLALEDGKVAAGSSGAEARVRVLCVAFLCLQYAAYALLRRYSTGILKEQWSAPSVLGMGELIKFVISLSAISGWASTSEAPAGTLAERVGWLLANSLKMAVPAFLYLTMNFLGFVALRRVDAGTFAILQQSKIFFTAALGRLMLRKVLSVPKWCALTILVCGVCLISLESQPSKGCPLTDTAGTPMTTGTSSASAYLVGVVAVLTDSALSGFATVYFELVLKTTVLTVWDRNVQLAFWSMVIYLPWALYEHPTAPLFGWSAVTICLALLGALGGILVALVIKHADGLAKNLATASSIVLTTAASHALFGGPMSLEIGIGCLVVIVAGFMYQKVA